MPSEKLWNGESTQDTAPYAPTWAVVLLQLCKANPVLYDITIRGDHHLVIVYTDQIDYEALAYPEVMNPIRDCPRIYLSFKVKEKVVG